MLYQLPNGKTIYLDVEDYLSLTDIDIQNLIALNIGDDRLNPFKQSVIHTKSEDYDEEDEFFSDEEINESYFEEYFPDNDDSPTKNDILNIPDSD
jgi:hypothetical protein